MTSFPKQIIAGVFVLLISFRGYAQAGRPDYGVITPENKALTTCSFDPEADAAILMDVASATYNDKYNLITQRRLRFKILKPAGIERGNITIPYYSKDNFETLYNIKGNVYNWDGSSMQVSKLEKNSIFRQEISPAFSELRIAMPDVRLGSIIEISYESLEQNYSGLDRWKFQADIPTYYSQFDLVILPGRSFAYKLNKRSDLEVDIRSEKENGRIIFTMKNIAGLRPEPYMDAMEDYRQQVSFQLAEYQSAFGSKLNYANTWQELARSLLNNPYFGKDFNRDLPGTAALVKQARALPSQKEKLLLIWDYVRSNISWNGQYGFWSNDGIKKAWEKQAGTSGEINLILINLLKEANLQAAPLLVSTRNHRRVAPDAPFLDQFNHLIAKLSLDNQELFLDASNGTTPMGMIPFELLNTNAFLVTQRSAGIIELTDQVNSKHNLIVVQSKLTAKGQVRGRVKVKSTGYAKTERQSFLKDNSQTAFTEHYFLKPGSTLVIDSLLFTGTEIDNAKALEQDAVFQAGLLLNGDYYLADLNLFTGLYSSPFLSDLRFTDINFGCRINQQLNLAIEIPDFFEVETLPQNLNLKMPDNSMSISRAISFYEASRTVVLQITLQINKPVFTPQEYPYVKEFFKKMVGLLNEPLLLKAGKRD